MSSSANAFDEGTLDNDKDTTQREQELSEAANTILDVLQRPPLQDETGSIDDDRPDLEPEAQTSIGLLYEMLARTLAPLARKPAPAPVYIPPHFRSSSLKSARPVLIDTLSRQTLPSTSARRETALGAFYSTEADRTTLKRQAFGLPKGKKLDQEFDEFRETYDAPQNPIVFCHGLFGFDKIGLEKSPFTGKPLELLSYWRGIQQILEQNGVKVLLTRVPPSASIKERAERLNEIISEKLPGKKVNLIGHSMGGLDCRYLISHIKPTAFSIKSLTTIATPHRGSSFADYMLNDVIGRTHLPPIYKALETLGIPTGAFENLTVEYMTKEFNPNTPDNPNVRYYSYGSAFNPGLMSIFRFAWGVVNEHEGPNDG